MGQERAHRRYSPSQADRFFACKGSNNLLKRVPARQTSSYAEEGTKAHDVLEAALNNKVRGAEEAHRDYSMLFEEDLDDGSNNFYFSVQAALDYVWSIIDENSDAQMWIEEFVDPPLPAAPGEAGGFCDIGIYLPSQRELLVIDYKHGAGVAKDVVGNRQPLQYAAGFLYGSPAKVAPEEVDTVTLAIVQPRAYHADGMIREHTVIPYELYEYLEDLNATVRECEAPDAPLEPGEEQCRFCDARTLCPAREALALQVASNTFSQIRDVTTDSLPDIGSMDVNRLGAIRFHAPTLRRFLDDVERHCEELMRSGLAVPGAKLVETRAQRKYYGDERDVAPKIAAMLGERNVNEAIAAYHKVLEEYPVLSRLYNHKMIPLTDAEKLIIEAYKRRVGRGRKRQASEEAKHAFAFLTLKQSSGKVVVVNEDDPRPAVNKAHDSFKSIAGLVPPPTDQE